MMIDVSSQLGALIRRVESDERDGRATKVVVAERTYPSPVEDVWDALTNADRIPRWFLPVTGELRLGGRYQLEGNAAGEVLACDPPRRLEVTWEYGGDTSWVQVHLTPGGEAMTTLTLRHTAHIDAERWDEYGPGAVGVGWELGLLGLGLHLAGGASMSPQEADAWMGSGEGRAYVTASSAGWADAAIAAGEDDDAARAAQRRTTAFYTGVPEGDVSG